METEKNRGILSFFDGERLRFRAVLPVLCCLLAGPGIVGRAQDAPAATPLFDSALDSIDNDLEAELTKLARLRKSIAAEKPELARRANESASTLRMKQREYEIAKATQAATDHQLEERQKRLRLWRDERAYLDGLLGEFRKNFQGSVSLPEVEAGQALLSGATGDGEAATSAGLDLVTRMVEELDDYAGIKKLDGTALGPDGTQANGTFVLGGPVAWFTSEDGELSGLIRESGSLRAEVVPGTAGRDSIRDLVEGKDAVLAIDPTMGSAIAMEEIEGDWRALVRKGGIWIYPILLLAAIAFCAACVKWVQLLGIRAVNTSQVQRIIDSVNRNEAAAAAREAETIRHPAGPVLERGVAVASRPVEEVEESMYEKFLEAQPKLQRGLAWIAIASATSPLLGLLGTVTGMIKTFNQITIFGTGDARSLSSGISEALITTAFGLTVAIPALILHALLSRKVQGIRASMEMVSLAFINGLKKSHA